MSTSAANNKQKNDLSDSTASVPSKEKQIPLRILFVASECSPYVKTGGLADVIGTLPNALSKLNIDARVILPKYRDIPEYWKSQMTPLFHFHLNMGWRRQYCGIEYIEHNGVTYYFIDNKFYFGRDNIYGSGPEEGERFAYFCRAVLSSLPHIGFWPDIIHCNDWQSGMIPALLKIQYQHHPQYSKIKSLFTIHNICYQGVFEWNHIADLLALPANYFTPDKLEFYGCVSFMKAGLVYSDHISTVSPTYAQEIQSPYYGEKLDGLIRARHEQLSGILNGIDPEEYNPEDDMWLPAHFSLEDLSNKAVCKRDLQRELNLEQRPNAPIIAIIARLTNQKGLDLIQAALDELMQKDVQIVLLGKGDERYQDLFCWAAWRYQKRFATRIELNNPLSHRIFAAADMVLVPSQFEPCGLTQMICMRYGTVPIVRETGGLKDSVKPYNRFTGEGNGFSFANYSSRELLNAIQYAVDCYHNKKTWNNIMRNAMLTDFSWDVSAGHYANLYSWMVGKPLLKLPDTDISSGSNSEKTERLEDDTVQLETIESQQLITAEESGITIEPDTEKPNDTQKIPTLMENASISASEKTEVMDGSDASKAASVSDEKADIVQEKVTPSNKKQSAAKKTKSTKSAQKSPTAKTSKKTGSASATKTPRKKATDKKTPAKKADGKKTESKKKE